MIINYNWHTKNIIENVVTFPLIIFFSVFIVYLNLCLELNSKGFYSYINVAFDLDQAWFIDTISRNPTEWLYKGNDELTSDFSVKHPFISFFRYLSDCFQIFGLSENTSAIVVSLIFVSLTPSVFYLICRQLELDVLASLLTTLLFISSATFIVNAQVLDSYSIAQFFIVSSLLIHLIELDSKTISPSWTKVLVYTFLFGVTSYLVLLIILLELNLIRIKFGLGTKQIKEYLIKICIRLFFTTSILLIFLHYKIIFTLITDPISIAKEILWAVARPGEKTNTFEVAIIFIFNSLIAPIADVINIEPNVYMLDYRSTNFSVYGLIGAIFIIVSLTLLIIEIWTRRIDNIKMISLVWIIVNIVFHSIYQDRGSLFLYCGHLLPFVILLIFNQKSFYMKKCISLFIILLAVLFNNSTVYTDINKSIHINNPKNN